MTISKNKEQIDSLKTWWKMYGNLVTGSGRRGVRWPWSAGEGWNWYQGGRQSRPKRLSTACWSSRQCRRCTETRPAAGELAEKFGGTHYAALGAMLAARQSFDARRPQDRPHPADLGGRKCQDELKDLARLRLAAILLDDKASTKPSKQLDGARAAAPGCPLEMKGRCAGGTGQASGQPGSLQVGTRKSADKAGARSANCCNRSSTAWVRAA